jgi:predicted dehydrogenase
VTVPKPKPKLRIGIVGCGDVAHRFYLAPLASLADRIEIAACADPRLEAARGVAEAVRTWSPAARTFERLDDLLAEIKPDAVFDLTPPPAHAHANRRCLEAGAHLFSEKPIATTVAEADALIELARDRGLTFLCAPAPAATRRIRWLRQILDSGRLGRPTLIVARSSTLGPASWPEYSGDPVVFYGPSVGPVRDLGVYRLHEMVALLGPVRRVQATGSIAIPRRRILGGPMAGRTMEVTSPDHVLLNLEFASGALGQLLASFAVPITQAPDLEIHLSAGSISMPGDRFGTEEVASIFAFDPSPEGAAGSAASATGQSPAMIDAPPDADGWRRGRLPVEARDSWPVVGTGPIHFVACLLGQERPIMTAEQARHVLEIILAAYRSIDDGRRHELTTEF